MQCADSEWVYIYICSKYHCIHSSLISCVHVPFFAYLIRRLNKEDNGGLDIWERSIVSEIIHSLVNPFIVDYIRLFVRWETFYPTAQIVASGVVARQQRGLMKIQGSHK